MSPRLALTAIVLAIVAFPALTAAFGVNVTLSVPSGVTNVQAKYCTSLGAVEQWSTMFLYLNNVVNTSSAVAQMMNDGNYTLALAGKQYNAMSVPLAGETQDFSLEGIPVPMPVTLYLCVLNTGNDETQVVASFYSVAVIAPAFDLRQEYQDCEFPIFNQGQCGGCWAFASTQTVGDRYCIHEWAAGVSPSPQQLISCADCGGCAGARTESCVWDYLSSTTHLDTCSMSACCTTGCVPYTNGNASVADACPSDTCAEEPVQFTIGEAFGLVESADWSQVNAAIMQCAISGCSTVVGNHSFVAGPIEVEFLVYDNFFLFFQMYPDGIYSEPSGYPAGGHAVRAIGWGVEEGVAYWLLANQWGTQWGNNGTFKMARGINLCDIESLSFYGEPGSAEQQAARPKPGAWRVQDAADASVAPLIKEISRHAVAAGVDLNNIVSFATQVVAGLNVYVESVDGAAVRLHRPLHEDGAWVLSDDQSAPLFL